MRNGSLQELAALLKDQHARKVDVVASATAIRSEDGVIVVDGADREITMDGVTNVDGRYTPTDVFNEGLAAKLDVPIGYLRRMHDKRVDLYDANVNGWLHGCPDLLIDPDRRKFLFRGFRGENGEGVARAFLSDRFSLLDHLDALSAALDGVRMSMGEVVIDSCDLTDRRMSVRVVAPQIQVLAPELLKNYRSPFNDPNVDAQRRQAAINHGWYEPGDEPIVFAGFEISNSETGCGAWSVTPRMIIKVCKNGLKITKDAMRAVHLGAQMEEGQIVWSEDTNRKALQLITARTRDAVATFLDTDYMARSIESLTEQAGTRITGDVHKTVKDVGKKLALDEDTINGIFDHFILGGQMTAGGVMHAVTSYAQTVQDADHAATLEDAAIKALALAAGGK